jgi:hypothetical protein
MSPLLIVIRRQGYLPKNHALAPRKSSF